MTNLDHMPPCTNCYSTAHGVIACPDLAQAEDTEIHPTQNVGGITRRGLNETDEPDMSSIQRFRDSLPPRSEDMMPKHPAEESPPSDEEEIYWKGTCEIRDMELARLRKYIEDDEWMRYKTMLNHANTQCITGHVMDPNGPEEARWSEEIDRIERILMKIEEALND